MSTSLKECDTDRSIGHWIYPVIRCTTKAALQARGEPHPINVLGIRDGGSSLLRHPQ